MSKIEAWAVVIGLTLIVITVLGLMNEFYNWLYPAN